MLITNHQSPIRWANPPITNPLRESAARNHQFLITIMQIHIRLYGPLRDRLPAKTKGRTTLDLAEGATVQEIFQRLNLPRTLLVAVNNEHESTLESPLHDGDRVAFFSPVSGG